MAGHGTCVDHFKGGDYRKGVLGNKANIKNTNLKLNTGI